MRKRRDLVHHVDSAWPRCEWRRNIERLDCGSGWSACWNEFCAVFEFVPQEWWMVEMTCVSSYSSRACSGHGSCDVVDFSACLKFVGFPVHVQRNAGNPKKSQITPQRK